MCLAGDERNLAYIIGLPENAELGGPWEISSGRSLPGKGEVIIDRNIAEKSGIALGDEVEILGEEFEVIGLSEGTSSLVNSVAFISMDDFEEMRGSYDTFSFLLVKVNRSRISRSCGCPHRGPGQGCHSPDERRIRRAGAPGDQGYEHGCDHHHEPDRLSDRVGGDGADRIHIHTLAPPGIWHAESARRAQHRSLPNCPGTGNFKRHARLSLWVGYHFVADFGDPHPWVQTWRWRSASISLLKVGSVSLVIAAISAMIPIRQIAGLDPAMVFRGR